MKNWMSLVKVGAVAVAVMALLTVACTPKPAPPAAEKVIKIGQQLSITAFGGSGEGMSMGCLNYCQYVNDELGGIKYKDPITGKQETVKMELMWEDAGYNVARAISVYKKQQAAGVKAMVIMGSGTADGCLEFGIRDHMPIWGNGSSTSASMMKLEPKWWTSCFANMADTGAAYIDYISKTWKGTRPAKVAFIHPDVPAIRGMYTPDDINNYAKSKGVEVVGKNWLPFALTDATVELTRAKELEADYVYSANTTVGFMAVLMKDAARLGLKDKMKFATYQYAIDESIFKLAPDAVEGLIYDSYYANTNENTPGLKLLDQISQKYMKRPLQMLYICGGISAAPFVEALKIALEQSGYDKISGDTIRKGMYSIKDFDTGGMTGMKLTISENQIIQVPYIRHSVIEGGKFKVLDDWAPVPKVFTFK